MTRPLCRKRRDNLFTALKAASRHDVELSSAVEAARTRRLDVQGASFVELPAAIASFARVTHREIIHPRTGRLDNDQVKHLKDSQPFEQQNSPEIFELDPVLELLAGEGVVEVNLEAVLGLLHHARGQLQAIGRARVHEHSLCVH